MTGRAAFDSDLHKPEKRACEGDRAIRPPTPKKTYQEYRFGRGDSMGSP